MDIKRTFLNVLLQEVVYVEQPLGFLDHALENHVFKFHKSLYGLKQASRAVYETMSKFLIDNEFNIRSIYKTLFKLIKNIHIFLVKIYVDNIIFGSTNPKLCKKFVKLMHHKFEIIMMREYTFFS